MNYFSSKLMIICFFLSVIACTDKKKQNSSHTITTAQFKVWGNCEMCKETIEGALKVDGVTKANWNTESKQVEVTYDSTKISLDQIQKNVASAGYDNEKYKSNEKAYHSLPECCQYERK